MLGTTRATNRALERDLESRSPLLHEAFRNKQSFGPEKRRVKRRIRVLFAICFPFIKAAGIALVFTAVYALLPQHARTQTVNTVTHIHTQQRALPGGGSHQSCCSNGIIAANQQLLPSSRPPFALHFDRGLVQGQRQTLSAFSCRQAT